MKFTSYIKHHSENSSFLDVSLPIVCFSIKRISVVYLAKPSNLLLSYLYLTSNVFSNGFKLVSKSFPFLQWCYVLINGISNAHEWRRFYRLKVAKTNIDGDRVYQ